MGFFRPNEEFQWFETFSITHTIVPCDISDSKSDMTAFRGDVCFEG